MHPITNKLILKIYAAMKTSLIKLCLLFPIIPISLSCSNQEVPLDDSKEYPSPARFENAIKKFEASDAVQFPAQGGIVCIGSSSMRGWHKTITDDLSPLTIIPRGFGGSNMNDALHYAERIVLPYKPRAIVLYEGDNDVAQGISPQKIANTFQVFIDKVHQELPECRIYFLSIKPSIKRWHMWNTMEEANALITAKCEEDKRLVYVDVASPMLNEKGEPREEIFQQDKLHMTRGGYVIWRDILKPVLHQAELKYEKSKPLS